jgi:DNA polymerase I
MVEKPAKSRPRLFLIDGYALIYRSFFALINRPLTTSRGENTSAAWGVTKFLQKIFQEHEPDYLGVVMDAGTSHREVRYPAYKATREKMPDELSASIPRIEQLVEAFRIPILELEDHEADDVIGTLAVQAVEQGLEAVIVSGDKDFYQLIRHGICLLNPGRGGPVGVEEEWVDLGNAKDRLGVAPEFVADYLALIGDSSDNIPGAKGIGPKTALQLIDVYGHVENILAHTHEITAKRARESLIENADDVRLSKELVTIMTELPIALDLEALRTKEPDRAKLREVFLDLEFHTLARDYAAPAEVAPEGGAWECNYELVSNAAQVESIAARARAQGFLAIDVEATHSDPMRAYLVGISVSLEEGLAYYLPFGHESETGLELEGAVPNLPSLRDPSMRAFKELLEDAAVQKVGHNLKYDLLVLRRAGPDR